jgi:uncharacterized protein
LSNGAHVNTQERELLTTFLTNLRAARVPNPDQEALSMIRNAVTGNSDAAYLLVQQALMQQAALGQAQARIGELEEQVRRAQATGSESSFLAGAGGWSNPPARSALPRGPAGGDPGTPAASAAMSPRPSGMGDFLRGAATTAVGVAGGALLFQGIGNLLGGHRGGGFLGGLSPIPGTPEIVENNTVINENLGGDHAPDTDAGLLGSPDPGNASEMGGDPSPFDDQDAFADQDFDADPGDWT